MQEGPNPLGSILHVLWLIKTVILIRVTDVFHMSSQVPKVLHDPLQLRGRQAKIFPPAGTEGEPCGQIPYTGRMLRRKASFRVISTRYADAMMNVSGHVVPGAGLSGMLTKGRKAYGIHRTRSTTPLTSGGERRCACSVPPNSAS